MGQARNCPGWLCCCNTWGMEGSLEPEGNETAEKKNKRLGNNQLGKRIRVLSCWRPTNTKDKATKGMVSRITQNAGPVISMLLQSRYLPGKDMQQETDQQDL